MRHHLPPILKPTEEGYEAQRDKAVSDILEARMHQKLHGEVPKHLRHVLDARPRKADGRYDPMRW